MQHSPPRPEDFSYHLPEELIAQHPLQNRSASKLLTVDRSTGQTGHKVFRDIIELLPDNTHIVWNNAKVIPARLLGKKEGTGGKAEVFLYRFSGDDPLQWEALLKVKKGGRPGLGIELPEGVVARIVNPLGDGRANIRFENIAPEAFNDWLHRQGSVPLPPYIGRRPETEDRTRYQTVYAGPTGAVAAPTAGLHFTPEVIDALHARNIGITEITLHVSLGTFLPLREENLASGTLHSELVDISPQAADTINAARNAGKKILAVGTTSVRSLESAADPDGTIKPLRGETNIFLYPPYRFKAVDMMLTNFHLPESSLMMLVCAFGGTDHIMAAYREAVEARYRFFSYGDAMLIT